MDVPPANVNAYEVKEAVKETIQKGVETAKETIKATVNAVGEAMDPYTNKTRQVDDEFTDKLKEKGKGLREEEDKSKLTIQLIFGLGGKELG